VVGKLGHDLGVATTRHLGLYYRFGAIIKHASHGCRPQMQSRTSECLSNLHLAHLWAERLESANRVTDEFRKLIDRFTDPQKSVRALLIDRFVQDAIVAGVTWKASAVCCKFQQRDARNSKIASLSVGA